MINQLKDEIKSIVIKKVKGAEESDVEMWVDEAIDKTMDYCNISEVPASLKYTIVNIACDIAYFDKKTSYSNDSKVKSVTRSEVSITYADESAFKDKSEIVSSYSKELNRCRKLRR